MYIIRGGGKIKIMTNKIFGIDLGTTYSCIAYIDENGKPVVLKNAEGELTTPSVVHFESAEVIHVGSSAKESAVLYPDQVATAVKRHIGEPGYQLNINGVIYKPEDVSSYILKKLVNDANVTLAMEGRLEDGEEVKDVVITCPAYFGVTERDATAAAGKIAGLNVLSIINEPTAAAITYGVTETSEEKTVLVYDLGGGTFDVTMISVQPGEIRVICTGGDKNLGGKDWDARILMFLNEQFQQETGLPENILEDAETLQELTLQSERAKKLLSSKPKTAIPVTYDGEHVRVVLTRDKFEDLTADLLQRTIDRTKDMFAEAEKKGYSPSDVSEILLVGGSSKMPQVMNRITEEFGIEAKMYDPDEAVAKGAAIYAHHLKSYNIVADKVAQKIADTTGQSMEDIKEKIDSGETSLRQEVEKYNILTENPDMSGMFGAISEAPKIINVSSRSFGEQAYHTHFLTGRKLMVFNMILKNADLPAEVTKTFYTMVDNQTEGQLTVYESMLMDDEYDPSLGKEIGTATLVMPPHKPKNTPVKVTFKLNREGLLYVKGVEPRSGNFVEATFDVKGKMSDEEMEKATERNKKSSVD